MDTQQAQASSLQSEGRQVLCGREEEEAAKDILSLGFLSLSNIVLSEESIQKKLLGFSRERERESFPRYVFVSLFYDVHVFLSVILMLSL